MTYALSTVRRAWLPAVSFALLLLSSLPVRALPTAVNDSFFGTEDTVLTVSGGASIFSVNFDTGVDGFAYADDTFGTTAANFEAGSQVPTGGFNATGGLQVRLGNRSQRASSGGWRRTFSLSSAVTVTVAGRYRIKTIGGMETSEWGDFIVDVNGTRYGSGGTAPNLYVERLLGPNVQNQGNTLETDTGWKQFTQNVPLAAGTHTLTLGAYNNNSSANGEFVELYLDEVSVTSSGGGGGVLSNDTGTAPVNAVKDTDPAHGAVALNSDGTFTYTPVANYFGADSFTYHAVDSTGSSSPATVTINLTAVNDAPVAQNDAYSTNEDTPLTVSAPGVLANDSDPDGTSPTAEQRSPTANGALTLNANGSFTYTPNANFNGTDTFTYRANDGALVSADRSVTITVNAVNDAPITAADSYRTPVNTTLNVSLTSTAGQPTTTETLVAAGSTVPLGDPAEVDLPVWRFRDDGSDQGTAWRNPGFNDSTWFTGKAELGYGDAADGRPERTLVGFGPSSTTKYATTYFRTTFEAVDKGSLTSLALRLMRDDAAIIYLNGTEIYRDRSANGFPDLPANPLFSAYANGTISNADEAALVDLSSFLVSNAAQYLVEGTNTLAVEIHQANGTSTDISMDLLLTAQRVPYAGVLANDSDPEGSAITAQQVTGPSHGALTLNANGTFSYTPAASYAGPDSFTYRATDGSMNSANTTVSLTVVSAGNAPPLAVNDSYSTVEDTALTVSAPGVLTNDSDPESGAITAQLITTPAHGALTLNADGSFTYTPAANYNGPDSFTYRARDAANANSNPAIVSLTVTAVNDPPVGVADAYGTNVGQTLTVNAAQGVLANDTDAEGTTLTAALVSGPVSGTLNLAANGSFTYTPPAGFSGVRTFTYRASDGVATTGDVTVTITMNGAPTAANESWSTAEDTTLTVNAPGVLANDSDPENSPLTALVATQPAHGSLTLNPNGSLTYTPAANYFGSDSFTYQASDGVRLSAPATVSLTVTAVNDAPVAQADSYTAIPDQVLTVATAQGILSNDSDAENSPLTLNQLTSPASGFLTLSPDGSFTYLPNTGFTGTDSFTYRVSDGSLFSSTATVTITVAQAGGDIVINEIMYRPGSAYPEVTNREFIELHNRGTSTVDLTGWTISAGVAYTFPAGRTMTPGSYLVVAANVPAFQAIYPTVTNVIGGWTGTLSNGGEKIELTDAAGNAQDRVSYASEGDWAQRIRETTYPTQPTWNGWDWSTLANGGNRSMELRNPAISNDNGQNWSVSSTVGGTPGAANGALTTNIPPVIKAVKHVPAVPLATDRVLISCELNDESPVSGLTATLFWRDATSATPGAFQSVPMSTDGKGGWFAPLDPKANLTIVEFYISASDGVNTRTWPAPTSEGQNANCQYQVSNEAVSSTAEMIRLTLTGAENAAYAAIAGSDNSGNKIDRKFNQTMIVTRGQETSIRYRCDVRFRGNSSRSYQFKPLRVTIPGDDDLDGSTGFNLNPKAPFLQHFGMRMFQAAGLRAPDTIPVELRRNGVEYTTSSGTTPDYGLWVRMEDIGSEYVNNHYPLAGGGGAYKKGRSDWYWRATQTPPANPDTAFDGFLKQNNSAANDWTDLTGFFSTWMAACAPHFPASNPLDVAASGGGSTSGVGNWNSTAFTAAEIASVETVADLDQWARWFAVMTILEDNETNVSNGQDDDYGVYFEPRTVGAATQRRVHFIPHDLDTIFGLGDSTLAYNSHGLYDSTEEGSVFRPLLPLMGTATVAGNAAFRTKYFNALRELLGTVFNADTTANPNPPFYQSVDFHLGNWAPAATRTAIKTFINQRRTYLLGLLGAGATTPPAGTSNATVTSIHGSLIISEVLADNVAAHPNGGLYPDVVELRNTGASAVSLAGRSLTDDPLLKAKYVFPSGTSIPAGGYLIVYADSPTTVPPPPGIHLGFALDGDGDGLYLYDSVAAGQALIDSVVFGLQVPDLTIGRTGAALDTWALCTPTLLGAANTAVTVLADPATLRINEFLGNADYRATNDFIELYNSAAQPVAIGGMSLTDDFINYPFRSTMPPLSFMGANKWVEFEAKGSSASPGNARELPFGIDATVGSVALIGANGSLVDRAETLVQFRDVSTGRLPDGIGVMASLNPPSPGFTNVALSDTDLDLLNYLRITELMYNPATTAQSEYIEFRNISDVAGTPVALELGGVTFKNGITFTFPTPTTLEAGAYIVIVGELAKFHTQFDTQFPGITIGGVFTGKLDNGGEHVRFDIPGFNIPILDFTYSDGWYPSTDGGGDALQIASATAPVSQWDKKSGWQASPPNPGTVPAFSIYAGPDISAAVGVPVLLDGALNPGTFTPSSVALAWTVDSGPGSVSFTTGNYTDANATFSAPGVYVLRLTGTSPAPGPLTVTDLVTVTVSETYDSWAARVLASQSAANRLPNADPDRDGVPNVAEFVLGGNPLNGNLTGMPEPVPGSGLLSFTWQRNLLADPAIQVIPQLSEDLQSWQDGPTVLFTVRTGTNGPVESWQSTETGAPGARSRAYGRLLVVMP